MLRALIALAPVGIAIAGLTASAAASPTPFELAFDGRVGEAVTLGTWKHEGSFVASSPFCSAGYGRDLSVLQTRPHVSIRRFDCGDGSGSFTARVVNLEAERTLESAGSWQIIDGEGAYLRLRGKGTLTGIPVTGDPQRPETLTFHATWRGVVDFDDEAPTVDIFQMTATKIRRPSNSYLVKVVFSAVDDGNTVTYQIRAMRASFQLAGRKGHTSGGTISLAMRVRSADPLREVRIEIDASDPYGNTRSISRSVKLPR